jgi:hypothetical protein
MPMNRATLQAAEMIRGILDRPPRGVAGFLDDLLNVCGEHALQLDWQAERLRVRPPGAGWEEVSGPLVTNSVLRAVLARIAVLCNERTPGSVSPYGGQGWLCASTDPAAVFRVSFSNTPQEQRLELTSDT